MSAETFLDNVSGYTTNTDSAQFVCPSCAAVVDVRVGSGKVHLGYIYSAGEPHFAAIVDVSVPGLGCNPGGPATYNGRSWEIT